jgi:hypothetical protein
MRTAFVAVAAAVGLLAGTAPAHDVTEGMKKGTPAIKGICALAFGPHGVMFVADPTTVTVYAIATGDDKPVAKGALDIDKIDTAVADLLGSTPADVTINDVKVNPASGNVYLAATRKGANGGAVVLKVGRDKKLTEVSLKDVMHSSVAIQKAAGTTSRAEAVTGMAFVDGRLIVAALSTEEFASSLRAFPFPFKEADKGVTVEMYHAAHQKLETNSPIQTFTPYKVSGADYIIASYTCTPLVRVPVADLKPGAKIKGTTVAELGNRNKPLDIIVYSKGGKDYALMANNARGVMKIGLSGIDKADGLTQPVTGGGTAGVGYEKVASLEGVVQLDKLDAEHALIVVKGKDNVMSLKTIELP